MTESNNLEITDKHDTEDNMTETSYENKPKCEEENGTNNEIETLIMNKERVLPKRKAAIMGEIKRRFNFDG